MKSNVELFFSLHPGGMAELTLMLSRLAGDTPGKPPPAITRPPAGVGEIPLDLPCRGFPRAGHETFGKRATFMG